MLNVAWNWLRRDILILTSPSFVIVNGASALCFIFLSKLKASGESLNFGLIQYLVDYLGIVALVNVLTIFSTWFYLLLLLVQFYSCRLIYSCNSITRLQLCRSLKSESSSYWDPGHFIILKKDGLKYDQFFDFKLIPFPERRVFGFEAGAWMSTFSVWTRIASDDIEFVVGGDVADPLVPNPLVRRASRFSCSSCFNFIFPTSFASCILF